MVSGGQLLGFALASLVLIVVPGPGVLFVVGRALAHGRRTAVATAVGHAAGNYVVATCVAVGLGTLLERSAEAFVIVKIAGAAYLIWLGVHTIRQRKSLAEAMAAAPPREGWRALRDGAVVGLTNPKAYILFGAILPQFVNRAAGDVLAVHTLGPQRALRAHPSGRARPSLYGVAGQQRGDGDLGLDGGGQQGRQRGNAG